MACRSLRSPICPASTIDLAVACGRRAQDERELGAVAFPPLPRHPQSRPDRKRIIPLPHHRRMARFGEFREGAGRVTEGAFVIIPSTLLRTGAQFELAHVGGSQAGLDQRLAADVCGGFSVLGHGVPLTLRAFALFPLPQGERGFGTVIGRGPATRGFPGNPRSSLRS